MHVWCAGRCVESDGVPSRRRAYRGGMSIVTARAPTRLPSTCCPWQIHAVKVDRMDRTYLSFLFVFILVLTVYLTTVRYSL
jgi:hypothetical protein